MMQADCYVNIGVALLKISKYEEAIAKQEQALKIYQTIESTERDQAICYVNIGSALRNMGKYEEAIAKQEQALKIFQIIKGTEKEQAGCYLNTGNTLRDMGQYEEGIVKQEQALKIYQTIKGTEREQANCYKNIGVTLSYMSQYEEVIAKQEQALKIYQTIKGTERDQAGCYNNIGAAFTYMSQYEEGIVKQEQALKIYQTIKGTEREQAGCYNNIGFALDDISKYEEAIVRYKQALKIYQTIKGTEREQAGCYTNIGVALSKISKYEEGIAKQEQALKIYQTIKGTERDQADCYNNISNAFDDVGKHEEAIVRYKQALKIYQTIKGTEREQAGCYKNIGVALDEMSKYEEGIAKQEQALRIYQTIKGTEREQAGCYMIIGGALVNMGKHEEGIAKQEQALKIYQTINGTEREQAGCYTNIGGALMYMGRYEEGIAKLEQALEIFQTIKGTEGDQGSCWGNIGEANLHAVRFSEAISAYQNSQKTIRGWWVSRGLGQAYRFRCQPGDEQKAVAEFWNAVQLAEKKRSSVLAFEHRTGIFDEPSKVFPDFASLLVELNEKKAKIQEPEVIRWIQDDKSDNALLESAFHFADRGKGRALEDALREKALMSASRPDEKLLAEDHQLSLRISRLTAERDGLIDPSQAFGSKAFKPTGNVVQSPIPVDDERKKKLTQEIETLQQRRNMIEVELKRTAIGAYVSPEFRKPMEMAKELPEDSAILQYSVGEKEALLLVMTRDGITSHRLGVDTPALPELFTRQEADIVQLLDAWKNRPDKIGLDGLVKLARKRVEDWGEDQRSNITAQQEKAILERLGSVVLPVTALMELREKNIHHLLVIPDGSLHYIPFAMLRISKSKESSAQTTDQPSETKDSQIVQSQPTKGFRTEENANKGFQRDSLNTIDKENQYLVEEFSINYIPAMTTLDTVRKQKQQREQKRQQERMGLLAFANPDFSGTVADNTTTKGILRSIRSDYYTRLGLKLPALPETEEEAMQSASLFPPVKKYNTSITGKLEGTSVFTGKAASEEQVKQILGVKDTENVGWQYLLLSTHGLADPQNGMLSCIAFSSPSAKSEEDGFLQAQEVLGLQLDTDMVVLSACETGLGRMQGGEGLVGLSASFFYAGAESICASLWSVPSDSTMQLVVNLFKLMKEGKMTKAESLRQSQLNVMKTEGYSDPWSWAAFVLIGE
jgi:tetratricopeptide (TPR) repeat protein/CHAT domain-containing protein